jgi:hypothetical protein
MTHVQLHKPSVPAGLPGLCVLQSLICLVLAATVQAAAGPDGHSHSHPAGDRGGPAGPMFPPLHEPGVRAGLAGTLAENHRHAKRDAWEAAASQGWSPWEQSGDTVCELMYIRDGWVCVFKTQNVTAAVSTAVDAIREVPPFNLGGAGQTVGVWDAGAARRSHRELTGRVSVADGAMSFSHSTHVTGTICAAGVDARALGMAPVAHVVSYDFDEDLAEATALAMSSPGESGMIQISNHSYGWVCGWDYSASMARWYGTWGARESDMFGSYSSAAHDWDALCYAAPYYLPFKAVGNDRADPAPRVGERFEYYSESRHGWMRRRYNSTTDPRSDGWDRGGYDTITPDATAKNIVTVGAIELPATGGRRLDQVTMTGFSGWGPTDDGRVKPDLVTHGVDLYSCTADSDRSYGQYSGTSMSTAVASGSATLLLEFYARLFPKQVMRSATLKALLIHTADDLGNPGPDYCYGWGLINVKVAAQHIQNHKSFPNARMIVEDAVSTSIKARSYPFVWDGSSPIRATLVWTDPPAAAAEGLDNASPRLVNDLDLRITGPDGTAYSAFVLDPAQPDHPAGVGDNTLDNVEQVPIRSPKLAGTYSVRVTFKGSLVNQKQEYSLLISGQRLSQSVANASADVLLNESDPATMDQSLPDDGPSQEITPPAGDEVAN